jgi:anti-anti-sigma factor
LGDPLYIPSFGAPPSAPEFAGQQVQITRVANGVAIRCGGEFDAASCASLRRALERAAEGAGDRVLVDLTEATFVDCRALTLIVVAAHRLADRGGTLVLALGVGQPRRLAELTGLAELLDPGARRRAGLQAG